MPYSYEKLLNSIKANNTDEQNNSVDIFADWTADFQERGHSDCICGKQHIKELNTIRNTKTQRVLYPIGSSCIKRFMPKQVAKIKQQIKSKTCKCKNAKDPKFSKCDECFKVMGVKIRGVHTIHSEMEPSLMRWLLEKHRKYQDGELRQWLFYYLNKTRHL